jgi:hypothetical protein
MRMFDSEMTSICSESNADVWFFLQALREKAKQNAAKKTAPYQKVIESYGFN